jgi:(2R)-ethylmalonyl-CoA mutase
VVGKPGLDGHSNGAEQISVRATDVGMDVVYDGIRLTPAQIVEQAKEAKAQVLGLSIPLRLACGAGARRGAAHARGRDGRGSHRGRRHHPGRDVNVLKQCGASAVYTPKDFQLNEIMVGIVKLVDAKAAELCRSIDPRAAAPGARAGPPRVAS